MASPRQLPQLSLQSRLKGNTSQVITSSQTTPQVKAPQDMTLIPAKSNTNESVIPSEIVTVENLQQKPFLSPRSNQSPHTLLQLKNVTLRNTLSQCNDQGKKIGPDLSTDLSLSLQRPTINDDEKKTTTRNTEAIQNIPEPKSIPEL
jgi:hypothetical protein